MRPIFINGRFLTQRVTGTQRYAHEVLDQLDRKLEKLRADSPEEAPSVTILAPTSLETARQYRSIPVRKVGRSRGQIWEQVELPLYARGGVLFSMVGGAPLLHSRNILTLHDASVFAVPESFSKAFRRWYQFLYGRLCHSALHLMTVSHFSRAEIVRWSGTTPERITVTYLGAEHALRPAPHPEVLSRFKLLPRKYVLAVGSRNPNKNIGALVRAFATLTDSDLDLAIAGPSYAKVFGNLEIAGDRVHDLGYVSDSELRTLYENAACFVFPSFYEGFGLPPLEALALGCPAVVADRTSLREIFESVAFLCDPSAPDDIAAKVIAASLSNEADRLRFRQFAEGFKWEQCAEVTWQKLLHYAEAG